MNRVYYSTVIDQPADRVWSVIRDFNSYPVWVEGINESHIEDNKAGDAVGAIRNFSSGDTRIRQRLLAHSDLDRSYTFESCGALGAITYYRGNGAHQPHR
jgi:ribosome-associated toxin RatA of RatAB toxin-antitoxin module